MASAIAQIKAAKSLTAPAAHTATAASVPALTRSRELMYLDMFEAWICDGDMPRAIAAACAIVAQFPADLFALKRAALFYFIVGDHKQMLAVCEQPAVWKACSGQRKRDSAPAL